MNLGSPSISLLLLCLEAQSGWTEERLLKEEVPSKLLNAARSGSICRLRTSRNQTADILFLFRAAKSEQDVDLCGTQQSLLLFQFTGKSPVALAAEQASPTTGRSPG